MEIDLTGENFRQEVLESDIPVLVDFWASWCGPCMMIAPNVEHIAQQYDGRLKVCKVNVDEQPELTESFGINSIPSLLVFKNGEHTDTAVGYRSEEQIRKLLAL